MRTILILVAIAWFVSAALVEAQVTMYGGARANPLDPNAPRHDVSGTVVNALTGEPIPRALVQIMGPQQRSDFTDSQGSFHFDGVVEGPAMFTARKPGYFSREDLARGSGPRIPIKIGDDMPPVVLKLTPEGIVTGTITGDDDEPLEGVRLRFRRQEVMNGRKQWEDRQSAITNEDGEFRVAELPPGAYYVLAEDARPVMPRMTEANVAYPPTYYPGVPDLSSAAAINVQGAQVVRLDFRMRAQPVYEISGTVTGVPPGQPAQVRLMNRSGEPLGIAMRLNPQDGKFNAKVAAGTYMVRASARDEQNRAWSGSTTFTASANLANIRLVMQPTISIPVVVRTEFTRTQTSQPGGTVSSIDPRTSRGPQQYVSVMATKVDEDRMNPFAAMERMPDNATFGLRNVEPGRYAAQISPHGPWYVQSATFGETDLLREDLVITQGGHGGAIEIVLRDDGGSISGSVMSDNNPASALVLVVPERGSILPPQWANERSGFHTQMLAPGDYSLFAFDSMDGLEYTNREALDAYTARATRVSVSVNSSANVTLTLIKRGEP
jgi:hypothetical protein